MRAGALRRPPPGALLLLVALLAGCGAPGDGDGPAATVTPGPTPTDPPPAPPASVPLLAGFRMEDCHGASLLAQRDAAAVQALLPDGYKVEAVDGMATVALDIFGCADFATPTTAVGATWFGQLYTLVQPPPARATEAAVHEYAWRLLAQDDVLAQVWQTAGYNVTVGNATLEDTEAVPGGLDVRRASTGPYRITASTSPVLAVPLQDTFARYTEGAFGTLVWTGTYVLHGAQGQGTMQAQDEVEALAGPTGFVGDAYRWSGSMEGMDLVLWS